MAPSPPTPTRHRPPGRGILILIVLLVAACCAVVWLSELLDFPDTLLGIPPTPLNWSEAALESVLIMAVGVVFVLWYRHAMLRERRADLALRGNEARLQALVRNMPNGIVTLFDHDLRFTVVGGLGLERVGLSAEELIGRRIAEFTPAGETSAVESNALAALDGETRVAEVPFHGEIWEVLTTPVRDRTGMVFGGMAISRIITEHREAERQVHNLAKFPAENPDPVLRIADDGTVLYANAPAKAVLVGLDSGPSRPAPEEWRAEVRQALAAGTGRRIEVTHADRIYALRFVPVSDAGYVNVYSTDVTERRQAEEALRQSEERFRTFFDSAPDGFYLVDAEGRFVDGNRAAEAIVGYVTDELVGETFRSSGLLSADELPRAVALLEQSAAGHSTGPDEFVLNCKDGSTVPVEIRTKPVTVGDQRLILGIARDITDRKAAEQAVQASELRYRAVVDNASVGIVVIQDGRRVFYNPYTYEMLGYRPEEYEAVDYLEFVHPDDRPLAAERIRRRLTGEVNSLRPVEMRLLAKGGDIRWVVAHSTLIEWDGKQAVQAFVYDVTERKQTEEALRDNEQFLQTIFDGMEDGITVRDRDLNLLRVNRWVEERYPDRMPLVGRKCYEAFQQRDDVCPWCPATRAMDTGRTQSEISPYPSAENPRGWLELTAFPMRSTDGEVVGVIEHVKDVTDRVMAEQEGEAYQEHLRHLAAELVQAEESERRRLAANLHDSVGQALATAKLALQDLQQRAEADAGLADGFRQAQQLVGEAIEHTRSTVFDLSPPILHEVGLEAALESLVQRVEKVHGLPVTLKEEKEGSAPLSEEVRVILYRSVRELLHNVVRHAAATRAAVAIRRADDHIRVVVEDNGMGFDLEAARGRGDVGSGFGFFNIRERLDYLGGSVDIQSKPDYGTRVTLTAPLEPTD